MSIYLFRKERQPMTKKRNLLILILIFAIALLAFTSCSEKPKLSELEDEEFIKYATDSGVNFPETFDMENDMVWIREWITRVEGDHNYPAPPYSKDRATLAEELREMFFKYYDGEFPEPSDENELSDLEHKELYQYIIDAGADISINPSYLGSTQIGTNSCYVSDAIVRYIIALLEDDPELVLTDNYDPVCPSIPGVFVEELRPVVAAYNADK